MTSIKILSGKHKNFPLEIFLEVSPKINIFQVLEKMGIKPIQNEMYTLRSNAEEAYLENWVGHIVPSEWRPLSTVCFSYRSYYGEKNWVVLQMLLRKEITIEEGENLIHTFWRVQSRVERYWKSYGWTNLRGLKVVPRDGQ